MQEEQGLAEEIRNVLLATVNAIGTPGKGILAADEDIEGAHKSLKQIGVEQTEDNRRLYKQVLLTGDKALSEHISGVILAHETFYQKADDGTPFVHVLRNNEIMQVGITMDKGLVPLGVSREEFGTQGLDSLRERASQYKRDGATFAKWRAVYSINSDASTPSYLSLVENANTLARYASICQRNGLVPIVEPIISSEGEHDLETAQAVTEMVWCYVYKALSDHHVFLEGTILKTSMVTPGDDYSKTPGAKTYTDEDIAKATVTALKRTVPVAVPVIGFLSGGQSDNDATRRLKAINKFAATQKPENLWYLTFCFGRALTRIVLTTWKGDKEKIEEAQKCLLERAKECGDATKVTPG